MCHVVGEYLLLLHMQTWAVVSVGYLILEKTVPLLLHIAEL